MSDNTLKYVIALCGTIVCLLAYFAGYQSGQVGWWWTSISMVVVFVAILKIVEV